jgi:hypothetical protein
MQVFFAPFDALSETAAASSEWRQFVDKSRAMAPINRTNIGFRDADMKPRAHPPDAPHEHPLYS